MFPREEDGGIFSGGGILSMAFLRSRRGNFFQTVDIRCSYETPVVKYSKNDPEILVISGCTDSAENPLLGERMLPILKSPGQNTHEQYLSSDFEIPKAAYGEQLK